MAISINKVSSETQKQIIDDYKNGKSLRQIEKDYGVTRQTTSKFLSNLNIKTSYGNHYRKYHHNENYFEIIDTEDKAYWLGFMFADGYIVDHSANYGEDEFGISISIIDKKTLETFKNCIESTNPILEYNRKDNVGENLARIKMSSQKTVDDLINKGCVKQKSHVLKPPKNIPNEFIRHFIRGFFDGDGSITKSFQKGKYIYGINITTTLEMAEWIKDFFQCGSVVKEKRRELTYYYSLGGHLQVLNFYHLLYDNATIYMDRKYKRFQELLEKYNES